jgi:hypothetical protein
MITRRAASVFKFKAISGANGCVVPEVGIIFKRRNEGRAISSRPTHFLCSIPESNTCRSKPMSTGFRWYTSAALKGVMIQGTNIKTIGTDVDALEMAKVPLNGVVVAVGGFGPCGLLETLLETLLLNEEA